MSLYDDPQLYDVLLPAPRACVQFYTDIARAADGPVLELACGTGQLIEPIADAGVEMVGIDRAPAMLLAARRRISASRANVQLIVADMRQFELRRTFKLVIVARNSLLHLTSAGDLANCFQAVRRHLAADGKFVLDVFNPDVAILSRPSDVRFPVMKLQTRNLGEVVVEETADYDPVTQVRRATWYVTADGKEAGTFALHLRSIFPDELALLIEQSGLRFEARFGNYDHGPFSSESARQVVICRS